jgi:hypothetical protein
MARITKSLFIGAILLFNILYTSGLPQKYSKKESFFGHLRRFITSSYFKSGAECDACKALTEVAKIAFKTKPTENAIAQFLTKLCIKLKIEDNRVCNGAIQVFKGEVLTVFDEFFLSPDEVCGSLLGSSCAKRFNPDIFWNVTIPKTPKPPVQPIPPPKVTFKILFCFGNILFTKYGVTFQYSNIIFKKL